MLLIQKLKHFNSANCIDIGCGTGAIGLNLLKNQSNIGLDGIDISEEMIKTTSEKFEEIKKLSKQSLRPTNESIYENLFIGNIKEENKELYNKYDAALSSGVFTKLHLGPENIMNVLSTLRVGGLAIISVNSSAYSEQGYEEEMRKMSDENIVKNVEIITVRQWGDDRYTETAEVIVMEKV
jgi:predicted TPR repeat methyltransferase